MDPKPLLAYHTWISLLPDVRIRLAALFHIPRTGQVLVTNGVLPDGTVGGIVQQDGHSATDLYAITVEKMQEILNNEDEKDFHVLWNGVIENLDQIVPPPEVEQPVETAPVFVEEPKPKDTFIPRDPEELLKKAPEAVETEMPPAEEPVIAEISDMPEKEIQEGMAAVIKNETKTKPHAKTKATKAK